MKYLLCGEECDVGDLLAITVIELYEANIFEDLKNHKFYMLGKDNHGLMGTDTKLIKEFASQLFSKANPKKKDTIINLICNMFPRFYECIQIAIKSVQKKDLINTLHYLLKRVKSRLMK